ncbi:MAG: glutamate racemase [Anaeroplasmataceae bacterium]
MTLGIIDSGYGGLEFLKGIKDKENYILIMDKAFFPYGTKSREFLIKRTLYFCNYLKKKGCNKIILACNTLSLIALDFVKLIYKDVSGVIELLDNNYQNALFLGSSNSIKYINKFISNISLYDGQNLINKIENNTFTIEDIKLLKKIAKNYDTLILGCTHFIKIKKYLTDINYVSQDEEYKKRYQNVRKE